MNTLDDATSPKDRGFGWLLRRQQERQAVEADFSVSLKEAAELLGYSRGTLRGWIRSGVLKCFRIVPNGRIRILTSEITRLQNSPIPARTYGFQRGKVYGEAARRQARKNAKAK